MQWLYNVAIIGVAVVGLGLYAACRYFAGAVCNSTAKLDGKTAIITGANTGIGKATATDFAKRNARVIIACRNREKGKIAEVNVRRASGNNDVHFRLLDLASFASIRNFTKEILSEESRVDILVNNAGVMMCPFAKTDDGFELQFGVNHLGHFLLTNLLLDKIKQSPAGGRIVVLSSSVNYFSSKLDLDTINSEHIYSSWMSYCNSKLANVLFTKSLADRLSGTSVMVNAVDPGVVKTELARHSVMMATVFDWTIGLLVSKTPMQGAQTSIHCAVSEDIKGVSGEFFAGCKVTVPSKLALDREAAERLWSKSIEWTRFSTAKL